MALHSAASRISQRKPSAQREEHYVKGYNVTCSRKCGGIRARKQVGYVRPELTNERH